MSERGMSRVQFVRLGALVGLVPAASALAACGGDQPSGGGQESGGEPTTQTTAREAAPETTGEATSPGRSGSGGGYIALESQVPAGSALEFRDGGEPAVLVRLQGGDFAAYSAVCTHQGCTVAYNGGAGTLDCPCHGSVFDPSQGGAVQQGPAEQPLPEIPVEVREGEVRRA